MPVVPLRLGIDPASYLREVGSGASPSSRIRVGVPFWMREPARPGLRGQERNYVAASLDTFGDPRVREGGRAVLAAIERRLAGTLPEARWDEWERLVDRLRYSRPPRWSALWTVALIDWALVHQPSEYLRGEESLTEALARHLGIDLRRGPAGRRELFQRHVFLTMRAHIEADPALLVELAYEHQRRLESLARTAEIYDAIGWMAVFVFQLFPGVTSIRVLNFAVEMFIGYAQFAQDLWKMEQDGLITADEEMGAWFGLVGVFLPAATPLGQAASAAGRKRLADLAAATPLIAVGAGFLAGLLTALMDVAERIPRALAAFEVGFVDGYAEFDPETAIFIPEE